MGHFKSGVGGAGGLEVDDVRVAPAAGLAAPVGSKDNISAVARDAGSRLHPVIAAGGALMRQPEDLAVGVLQPHLPLERRPAIRRVGAGGDQANTVGPAGGD